MLRHCCLGDRKGTWPVKTECWLVDGNDSTGALLSIVLAVTAATSIISCCNIIQNGLPFWYRFNVQFSVHGCVFLHMHVLIKKFSGYPVSECSFRALTCLVLT